MLTKSRCNSEISVYQFLFSFLVMHAWQPISDFAASLWVFFEHSSLLSSHNWQSSDANKNPGNTTSCVASGAWTWVVLLKSRLNCSVPLKHHFIWFVFREWSLESVLFLLISKACLGGSWLEDPWAEPEVNQCRQSGRRCSDTLLAAFFLAGRHSLWLIFWRCPRAYVDCFCCSDT